MLFSATATHALRALAHLAAHRGQDAVLGRDLARELGLPAHYLSKVLATLARAGVLVASRGARGGYRLARPPEEIPLVQIVEPLEGARVRPGCLLRPGEPCSEEGSCSAHGAWSDLKAALATFLERTTLAEIQGAGAAPAASAGRGRGRRARHGAARTRQGHSTPTRRGV